MTDLQKLRNDLAKKYAEGFRYVDWHNTIEIYHAGFDAAVTAMQAEIDDLKNEIARLQQYDDAAILTKERDSLKAQLSELKEDIRLDRVKPDDYMELIEQNKALKAQVDELETKLGASDIKMQELFFENEKLKYKYDDPETWINKNYHDAEMKELEARSDSLNTQVELNEILKQRLEIAVKALEFYAKEENYRNADIANHSDVREDNGTKDAGGKMKYLLIVTFLSLTGCGKFERFWTHYTGDLTYKCAKTGIEYVQSDSGLSVLYDNNGQIKKCN